MAEFRRNSAIAVSLSTRAETGTTLCRPMSGAVSIGYLVIGCSENVIQ